MSLQYLPTKQRLTPKERELLRLFGELDTQDQASLLAFAEFLASRSSEEEADLEQEPTPLQPKPIPRPAKESVVKAIKRLSSSYYMLERDKMLDDTSSLMTAHVIQGRSAHSVIDDLEELFELHYQRYLNKM
jgi:hypothetical protein